MTWYDLRWRLAVIALTAIALFYIWSYLGSKYSMAVAIDTEVIFLNEKLFDWFMIGFILGIAALALLFEGEFLLGVRHIIREVERGAAKEWLALRHLLEKEISAARKLERKILKKTVAK